MGALGAIKSELTKRSLKVVDYEKNTPVWKVNNKKIEEPENQRQELEEAIGKLKEKLIDPTKKD